MIDCSQLWLVIVSYSQFSLVIVSCSQLQFVVVSYGELWLAIVSSGQFQLVLVSYSELLQSGKRSLNLDKLGIVCRTAFSQFYSLFQLPGYQPEHRSKQLNISSFSDGLKILCKTLQESSIFNPPQFISPRFKTCTLRPMDRRISRRVPGNLQSSIFNPPQLKKQLS